MKKVVLMVIAILVCSLITVSLVGFSSGEIDTTYIHGDYPSFESIDELFVHATEIVRVEILDERVERQRTSLPPQTDAEKEALGEYEYVSSYEIVTIHRLRVLQTFQGDAYAGQIIEVMQLGGRLDNEEVINEDKVQFVLGENLILFMISWRHIDGGPSTLLTPTQAVYHIGEDGEPESLPGNNLILTMSDLDQIRIRNGIDEAEVYTDIMTEDGGGIWIPISIIAVIVLSIGVLVMVFICRRNGKLKKTQF